MLQLQAQFVEAVGGSDHGRDSDTRKIYQSDYVNKNMSTGA